MGKGNTWQDLIFAVINYAIFIFICMACTYPFYYIFIYSISDPALAMQGITLTPRGFTTTNYEMLLRLQSIPNAFVISLLRTISGTVITVFCCAFFAYLVSLKSMWFRKFIYRFAIITMYFNAGIIPWYLTMRAIGLMDNFLLYILPSALSAFYIILCKTYIEQLPPSLAESATVDGANIVTVFYRIIFPLSMPIMATIAIFAAIGQWNQWFDNLLLITDPKLQTLQLILYQYLNSSRALASMSALDYASGQAANRVTPQSIQVTITMLTTLPILVVYPFFQRYFTKGIMLGAVKG